MPVIFLTWFLLQGLWLCASDFALAESDAFHVPELGFHLEAPNSEFLVGKVFVTVVAFESTGEHDPNLEDWTEERQTIVRAKITEATEWWSEVFKRQGFDSRQRLEFILDFHFLENPIATPREPILYPVAEQHFWVGEFLKTVGYPPDSHTLFREAARFNTDTRLRHGTDWAFTLFVIDSTNDADGKFPDRRAGYAFLGGPFMVLTTDNGGWTLENFQKIAAHEIAHIFYALDEYVGSSSYFDESGYLKIQNLNAFDENPNTIPRVDSLMSEAPRLSAAYASRVSSPSSLEMLGWRDQDRDGILDVLDLTPKLKIERFQVDGYHQNLTLEGDGELRPLPNFNPNARPRVDVTLSSLETLEMKLDQRPWVRLLKLDGLESALQLTRSLSPLEVGTHTLKLRLQNRWGFGVSEEVEKTFEVKAAP